MDRVGSEEGADRIPVDDHHGMLTADRPPSEVELDERIGHRHHRRPPKQAREGSRGRRGVERRAQPVRAEDRDQPLGHRPDAFVRIAARAADLREVELIGGDREVRQLEQVPIVERLEGDLLEPGEEEVRLGELQRKRILRYGSRRR